MVTRRKFSRRGEPQGQYIKLTTFGNIFYVETAYDVINSKLCEIPLLTLRVHIVATFDRIIMVEFRLIVRCYELIVHVD